MRKLGASVLVVLALVACTSPSSGPTYPVAGHALAGPTCPFEPPSPMPGQCDPRPVAGARLVVADSSGHEVATLTTGPDGGFGTRLAAGSYTLTPEPATGQLGVAPPITFTVSATDHPTDLAVEYDTGIR